MTGKPLTGKRPKTPECADMYALGLRLSAALHDLMPGEQMADQAKNRRQSKLT